MLVIDTSSRRVCVGLLSESGSLIQKTSDQEASLSLFPIIKSLLSQCDWKLSDIASIAFCEGPGSTLGIRIASMGIRTWKETGSIENAKIYSFSSLALGVELTRFSMECPTPFFVVTDARRNSWNALRVDGDTIHPIKIIDNTTLEKEKIPVYSFDEFPSWTRSRASIKRLPYHPEKVFTTSAFLGLLRTNENVDPMNLRSMEFAKWIPVARTAEQIES